MTFGFDQPMYTVLEGGSQEVVVTVMGGTLDREVVLTVMTVDGTATSKDVGSMAKSNDEGRDIRL